MLNAIRPQVLMPGVSRGLALVALLTIGTPLLGQVQPDVTRPDLSGTWAPADPGKSDKLFAVGLTEIPGRGRLTIAQRPDRITLTITMPDEDLDMLLNISGMFHETTIYRVSRTPGRLGGAGAGGPRPLAAPTWFDARLLIPRAGTVRPVTMAYSIEDGRLKLETNAETASGRTNTTTQWFTRVQ